MEAGGREGVAPAPAKTLQKRNIGACHAVCSPNVLDVSRCAVITFIKDLQIIARTAVIQMNLLCASCNVRAVAVFLSHSLSALNPYQSEH